MSDAEDMSYKKQWLSPRKLREYYVEDHEGVTCLKDAYYQMFTAVMEGAVTAKHDDKILKPQELRELIRNRPPDPNDPYALYPDLLLSVADAEKIWKAKWYLSEEGRREWLSRSDLELHAIVNLACNHLPTDFPINDNVRLPRHRSLKALINDNKIRAFDKNNDQKANVYTRVKLVDLEGFFLSNDDAAHLHWLKIFIDDWRLIHGPDNNAKLPASAEPEISRRKRKAAYRQEPIIEWALRQTVIPDVASIDVRQNIKADLNFYPDRKTVKAALEKAKKRQAGI